MAITRILKVLKEANLRESYPIYEVELQFPNGTVMRAFKSPYEYNKQLLFEKLFDAGVSEEFLDEMDHLLSDAYLAGYNEANRD